MRAEARERVVTREEVERMLLVVEAKTREVGKVEGALRGVRRVAEERRKARETEISWRSSSSWVAREESWARCS